MTWLETAAMGTVRKSQCHSPWCQRETEAQGRARPRAPMRGPAWPGVLPQPSLTPPLVASTPLLCTARPGRNSHFLRLTPQGATRSWQNKQAVPPVAMAGDGWPEGQALLTDDRPSCVGQGWGPVRPATQPQMHTHELRCWSHPTLRPSQASHSPCLSLPTDVGPHCGRGVSQRI